MQLASNLMCRVLGSVSQVPATRSPSGDTLCRHIFPLLDLQVVIFSCCQFYWGQIADAPCLYFDIEQAAVSRSSTQIDRHPRGGESWEVYIFPSTWWLGASTHRGNVVREKGPRLQSLDIVDQIHFPITTICFLVLKYRAHCLNDWSKVISESGV